MFAMTKGMLVFAIAMVFTACGPTETAPDEPDAMEVDASWDDAVIEGNWSIQIHLAQCTDAMEFFAVAPFSVEVESDADVVAVCDGCNSIEVTVESPERIHVDMTDRFNGDVTIAIDATDDGSVATATAHLVVGSCDFIDEDAVVERVRE